MDVNVVANYNRWLIQCEWLLGRVCLPKSSARSEETGGQINIEHLAISFYLPRFSHRYIQSQLV